jgi:hypothetical protein
MNASARLKQAVKCFATAVAKQPDQSLPYLSLGLCLTRLVTNEQVRLVLQHNSVTA